MTQAPTEPRRYRLFLPLFGYGVGLVISRPTEAMKRNTWSKIPWFYASRPSNYRTHGGTLYLAGIAVSLFWGKIAVGGEG